MVILLESSLTEDGRDPYGARPADFSQEV